MKNILIIILTMTLLTNTTKAQNGDYRFMIEQAILAPSGHNTQPWLFEIQPDGIAIHPNYSKRLPVVDADNRELFISLGCATENLCQAATSRGYQPEVSISPDSVVQIKLTPNRDAKAGPLLPFVALRQTNRGVYKHRMIPHDTIALLKKVESNPGVNVYFFENGTNLFDTLLTHVVRGNNIQMNDPAFINELKGWMRLNKRQTEASNDGLSYATFGAPNLPAFVAKPIISGFLKAKKQNEGDLKKGESSSHFMLITTNHNTLQEWIGAGQTLQRLLLESTRLRLAHAYMNQPCEVASLAENLKQQLPIEGQHPTLLLRLGYGDKKPYSKRKSVDEVLIK